MLIIISTVRKQQKLMCLIKLGVIMRKLTNKKRTLIWVGIVLLIFVTLMFVVRRCEINKNDIEKDEKQIVDAENSSSDEIIPDVESKYSILTEDEYSEDASIEEIEIFSESEEDDNIEDGNYACVLEMKQANLEKGEKVFTDGYYKAFDGGGAEYVISDTPDILHEVLENGLYANLVAETSINIRQLGAVGDGTVDDFQYFSKAISLGFTEIIVPVGIYNLGYNELLLPNNISIIGENVNDCILENVNITARYGLTLKNVTCEGGTERSLRTPEALIEASVMLVVSPIGEQSIEYENCIFKNTDIASFANESDGSFLNDIVKNCIFTNIGRVAVYHSLNEKNTSYCNNFFSEIGSKLINSGPVAAIWIGDITNNTYTQSQYIEIRNNTFTNLYTANDFDPESKHSINANFIAIRAEKADIDANNINNLVGYGNDREAVYTKVRSLTVKNNVIKNGGSGEGYICNKGQAENSNSIVINNTISGEFGCGICNYCGAEICNNSVQINYCKAAIISGSRSDQIDGMPVTIKGNNIKCGMTGSYIYSGTVIDDYNSGNLIKVISPTGSADVSQNILYPQAEYTSYIAIGNAKDSISIVGNIIDGLNLGGNGISIYSTSKSESNANQIIVVKENTIKLGGGNRAVNISFVEQGTSRQTLYQDNEVDFSDSTVLSYALVYNCDSQNNDFLNISGNISNVNAGNLVIRSTSKNLDNTNEGFAIVQ